MAAIHFFSEQVKFNLSEKRRIKKWINDVIKEGGAETGTLNFIFCSDEYLLNLNKEHLNHETYTDIITFDYSEEQTHHPKPKSRSSKLINGDIFISIDRVKENALKFEKTLENELQRVIIHGVLHLIGFKDKTNSEREKMREKENRCLKMLYPL